VSDRAPRVLHVHDCAFTAQNLVDHARAVGLAWRFLPPAAPAGTRWDGPVGQARKVVVGGAWATRLLAGSRWADLMHVHAATTVRHVAWTRAPYVVHLHGSDITPRLYEPGYRDHVLRALHDARAVVYATPDLWEHVRNIRPDAVHLPQPVHVAGLPAWRPAERPTVVFASRWMAKKGSHIQVEIARRLVAAVTDDVDVVGLDWGPDVEAARDTGMRLVPPVDHARYLDMLSHAHVVVGQCGGLLSVSEVEALVMGIPLLAPVVAAWYPDPPPVLGPGNQPPRDAVPPPLGEKQLRRAVDDVLDALRDPVGTSRRLNARSWAIRHHDRARSVETLAQLYARL
jgi:hypothetical protein